MNIKKTLIQVIMLGFAATMFTACSSDSDSSPNKNDYVWENGVCKSRKDGWVVEASRCNNGTSGGYYWANNQCYDSSHRIVSSTFCGTNNGTTGTYYLVGQTCYSSQTHQVVSISFCNQNNNNGYQQYTAYYDQYGRCIYNGQMVDYWYCGGQNSYNGGGYYYNSGAYVQGGVQLDGTAALIGAAALGLLFLL